METQPNPILRVEITEKSVLSIFQPNEPLFISDLIKKLGLKDIDDARLLDNVMTSLKAKKMIKMERLDIEAVFIDENGESHLHLVNKKAYFLI
ncbi:MAG: hypothetical protein ACTSUE_14430 [Promethearchaeota archaeon]